MVGTNNVGHANRKRSLVKTITWRIIATTDTFILTLFSATWFGDELGINSEEAFALASTVAALEIITKMVLYYFHERGWSSISWGIDEN
jgi:uncharacterized membrane protein|tara:strand:+ start:8349 stop:8615 length:267 start_codon:yes stop_codon:yes gene_type:complete